MALRRSTPLMVLESLDEIPDDLKALSPKAMAAKILVGDKAYKMYPLVEGAVEDLSVEIAQVVSEALAEIAKQAAAAEKDKDAQPLQPIAVFGQTVLRRGLVSKIISYATGIPEDQIQAQMTVPQIVHAAGVVWDLNFNLENYPQVSQGKVHGLLELAGIRGPKVFTQEVLDTYLDPGITDIGELRAKILSSATRCLRSEQWSQLPLHALALLPKTFAERVSSAVASPEKPVSPVSGASPSAASPDASSKEGTTVE